MNATVNKNEKVGFGSGFGAFFDKLVDFYTSHKEISAAYLMMNGHYVPYFEE